MKEKSKLIIDIIFTIIIIISFIWIIRDFEYFLSPGFKPSGKAAKAFILLLNFLNKIGGKIFAIGIIYVLVLPYIIGTGRNVFKKIQGRPDKTQDDKD